MMMNSTRKVSNVKYPLICFQSIRWKTKPRWIPKAKTKIFHIPRTPDIPGPDLAELTRINNIYNTQIKSIRYFLRNKYVQSETSEDVLQKLKEEEEDEWQMALKINEEWNLKVRETREKLDAEVLQQKKEEALNHVIEMEAKEQEELKRIDAIVRAQKEMSKKFITEENIDEAIEKALELYTDFNYCIDLKQNIYYGTRGLTPSSTIEESSDIPKQKEISFTST